LETERRLRAKVWRKFREDFLITQTRLADVLGISRRTVQQIEAGNVTPHGETLRRFAAHRQMCEGNTREGDKQWLKAIM
jgi:DNA-binding XRE family transcriptional regulator